MTVSITVSYGELLDKISILEIKSERIQDVSKLHNVRQELTLLSAAWAAVAAPQNPSELAGIRRELTKVNGQLWEIEDALRAREHAQNFDAEFIQLARRVYITNDRRAALKRDIDTLLGSAFSEEKSYRPY